jgi:hypothetical protein
MTTTLTSVKYLYENGAYKLLGCMYLWYFALTKILTTRSVAKLSPSSASVTFMHAIACVVPLQLSSFLLVFKKSKNWMILKIEAESTFS